MWRGFRFAWVSLGLLALLTWTDASRAQAPDTTHVAPSTEEEAPPDTTRVPPPPPPDTTGVIQDKAPAAPATPPAPAESTQVAPTPAPATPAPPAAAPPVPAPAVEVEEKHGAAPGEKARVYIGILLGLQTYAMNDVNDGITEANVPFQGSGFSVDKISGGFGFGGGLRVWPSSRIYLALDYMRLPASTENETVIDGEPVRMEFDVPANSVLATAAYFRRWHGLRCGLGAGGGYYICRGEISRRVGAVRETHDVKGEGPGFHVLAMGNLGPPSVHFEIALGYRFAKTGFLKTNGVPLTTEDGAVKADWNGLMTRFGIAIPFDPGEYHEPP
jgi:hypothetical protein